MQIVWEKIQIYIRTLKKPGVAVDEYKCHGAGFFLQRSPPFGLEENSFAFTTFLVDVHRLLAQTHDCSCRQKKNMSADTRQSILYTTNIL